MIFTPDGRAQECERCGFRNELKFLEKDSIAELDKALRFMGVGIHTIDAELGDSTQRRVHRDMLAQGITAVKQKKMDEAYFHLSRILKATNSHEEERLTAWFWLSAVADSGEEKRICLENVLVLNPGHPGARRGMAMLDGRLKEDEIIDPEQQPTQQGAKAEALKAAAKQMRCPRCDGRMNYEPEIQALQCDFCHYRVFPGKEIESETDIEDALNNEQDFIVALATAKGHRQPVRMRTIQCNSCGIEFILSPETLSLACPYCDSVYVVEAAETHEIVPPQGVIPFTVSHDEAKKALREWFQKHNVERPRVSPIEGAYIPVWTFDISGPLKWSCMVREGDQWVQRTGEHFTLQDDVLVPASNNLPHGLTEHFNEFDLTTLVPYDNRYLADIPAERYQITVADASLKARGMVMKTLRKRPERFAQVMEYRDFKLSARGGLAVQSYKLVLLPLWIAHYKVEDEVYDVTINGQNKAIHGARPKGMVGRIVSWLLG
jgi:Zn finger protein HypA/HybF involved in hydrogenase expression